jgi:hypothetical protein
MCILLLAIGLGPSLAWSANDSADQKPPVVKPPTWPDAVRTRNAEMKRRVNLWLADGKGPQMPLHVVYLSCADQKPFANHTVRLNRVLTEIQQWYVVQHEAAGFGRTSFELIRDRQQRVKLHEGKLPFAVGSRTRGNIRETHRACNEAAKAILAKSRIDFDRSFVLVLTTIPDDRGAAPFFGVILQDRGYCFAVDAPWLDSNYTQADGPVVWKGKRVGAANSALIGGMAHEMGHGFGLPHSDEPATQKRYGESLMASGNYTWREELRGRSRGSFLLDTDAMLLVARPPFTKRTRDLDKRPKARVENAQFKLLEDGRIQVTGNIRSDIPAHAIKLFDDPPGNGDYNAVAHAALPDEKTGAFEIIFQPLDAKGDHALRLVLFHVNGRWTQFNSTMTTKPSGKVDLTRVNRELGKL